MDQLLIHLILTSFKYFCDILDAVKKDPYERDPRGTAKKSESLFKKTGIGDKSYFGLKPNFFVFDDVRFKNDMNETSFSIDSSEGPYNTKNMKMEIWVIDQSNRIFSSSSG